MNILRVMFYDKNSDPIRGGVFCQHFLGSEAIDGLTLSP